MNQNHELKGETRQIRQKVNKAIIADIQTIIENGGNEKC
jgi:hypothetical protein